MEQQERLETLLRYFILEDGEGLSLPAEEEERRKLLRALFNVRMPKEVDAKILGVQDEYLQERAKEKGIVKVDALKEIAPSICLWLGDITRLDADAIVNAANNQMLGCFQPLHNCIDNCIHTYAGIELRQECDQKMQELRKKHGEDYVQPTGVPMLTEAYNLPAKKVIHVVGPIVYGKVGEREREQLASCYINCLDLAKRTGLHSIAFCCISTGVFGYPQREAASLASKTVESWLEKNAEAKMRVVFNCFKDEDMRIYERELQERN